MRSWRSDLSVIMQECEELQKKYAAQQDEQFLEHTQQQHVLYQQEQQILHQQIQVRASGSPTEKAESSEFLFVSNTMLLQLCNQVFCLWNTQGLSLGHVESQPSHLTHQLQRYTRARGHQLLSFKLWYNPTDWNVTSPLSRSLLSSPRLRIQPSSPPPTHPSNHLFRQPNQSPPPGSAGIMQGHGRWFTVRFPGKSWWFDCVLIFVWSFV